jgi:hypothetical protein
MAVVICVKCNLEMRPAKNGQPVESMTEEGPYQLIMGDKYQCPECGADVVTGLANKPMAEHFQENYGELREACASRDGAIVRFWSNAKAMESYLLRLAREHVKSCGGLEGCR